jgi:hypothetical protein
MAGNKTERSERRPPNVDRGSESYCAKLLKQRVDERGDRRALREYDEHAEAEKENNHGH